MSKHFVKNTTGWKIQTSDGFVDFAGVSTMGKKKLFDVTFTDGESVTVSAKHCFFTLDGREIQTRELNPGLQLMGYPVDKTVERIEFNREDETYDVIETSTHRYITNGIISHNCEFLSSEALLVSSIALANATPIIDKLKPINVVNNTTFWYDFKQGETYLVGVDPSTGSGEDYSVITIYHFPSMVQVTEYRSNTMSTNQLYGVLKNLLLRLQRVNASVYFSIENNGVGEGIIALYEADDNPPVDAEFISDEGGNRMGMATTPRSKMKACINFKEMFENGSLTISSKTLLSELKTFVRSRGSYAAQNGATDDCVSASLIVIKLIEEISTYEQTAFDKLYANKFDKWTESDWSNYDGYDGEYDDDDDGMSMTF